jgi:hypothetical protein
MTRHSYLVAVGLALLLTSTGAATAGTTRGQSYWSTWRPPPTAIRRPQPAPNADPSLSPAVRKYWSNCAKTGYRGWC